MQIIKKLGFIIGVLFFVCSFINPLNAQTIAENESGKKIVIYPNGSWAYYDNLTDDEKASLEKKINSKKKKKKKKTKDKKKKKGTKKDKKNKTKDKKSKKKNLVKTKTKSKSKSKSKKKDGKKVKSKSKKAKSKKTKVKKEKKPAVKYSLDEERKSREEAIKRAEMAQAETNRRRKLVKQEQLKLKQEQKRLKIAYEDTSFPVSELDALEKSVKTQESALKRAEKDYNESKDYAKKMQGLIVMNKTKRDKALAKIEGKSAPKSKKTKSKKSKSKSKNRKNTATANYSPNRNVVENPPAKPCLLAYNDVDEFTGKRRIELPKRVFFTHTADRLKPFFKDKSHITVEGNLFTTAGGGLYYLNLTITVLSEMAQREFGVLEKGSSLTVKLIDGANVRLLNTKTSTGNLNKVEKTVVYNAQYILDDGAIKSLKKSEVDKVRIVWGTGYEDYEVYELDFFINQIKCLDQNK